MTTVLLAIDDTDDSHVAAVRASELFGPDATYLAVHVGPRPVVAVGTTYGYPYPWTSSVSWARRPVIHP